jgi:hypothetical protein
VVVAAVIKISCPINSSAGPSNGTAGRFADTIGRRRASRPGASATVNALVGPVTMMAGSNRCCCSPAAGVWPVSARGRVGWEGWLSGERWAGHDGGTESVSGPVAQAPTPASGMPPSRFPLPDSGAVMAWLVGSGSARRRPAPYRWNRQFADRGRVAQSWCQRLTAAEQPA